MAVWNVEPLPRLARQTVTRQDFHVSMSAQLSQRAPRIPWDTFINDLVWRPGEHISIVGSTGSGKTTLTNALLPLHTYVVVFGTKPRDTSLDWFLTHGYIRLMTWQNLDPNKYPKRVLWPDQRDIDSDKVTSAVFRDALGKIYREGGWTLDFDETRVLTENLKLSDEIVTMLTQGRSLGISVVAGSQRPRWVPLEVFNQATHIFMARTADKYELARLSEIGFIDSELVKLIVPQLEQFQFLYINTRDGHMARIVAPGPEE